MMIANAVVEIPGTPALSAFRIAKLLRVEIYDVNAHPVFHFAFAKIVQMRMPMFVLLQIFGHMS